MLKPLLFCNRSGCHLILVALFLFVCLTAQSQQVHYTNFTVNDGLASNKIYNIIEDRFGFIWISTDHGVSRFDGVAFTNFTTQNGLPDNEVLGLFEDKKGRIWFNSFSTEPCYYFMGKIYNATNDSFLLRIKKHKAPGPCMNFIVQANNSIAFLIHERGRKIITGKDIEDIQVKFDGSLQGSLLQHILVHDGNYWFSSSGQYHIYWQENDSAKVWKSGIPGFVNMHYTQAPGATMYGLHPSTKSVWAFNPVAKTAKQIPIHNTCNGLFNIRNMHILMSDNGYTIYNESFSRILEQTNVPFSIQRIYIDRMGNKWFGSFDHGIYMINKSTPLRIQLPENFSTGILGVNPIAGGIALRTEKNGLLGIDAQGRFKKLFNPRAICRITGFASLPYCHIAGTDEGLYEINTSFTKHILLYNTSVKDIEPGKAGEILVGTSSSAFVYLPAAKEKFRIIDIERTTAICRINDSVIWLGGLRGLHKFTQKANGAATTPLALQRELDESRITDIKKDASGNIWVSTDQKGLFLCSANGKVTRFCQSAELPYRLISDLCLQISVHNNSIWVSTVGGLSVITRPASNENVTFSTSNYAMPDGMPDKIINQVAFKDNHVIISSPNGLFRFANFPPPVTTSRQTVITQIKANEQVFDPGNLILPYNQNNLIISYVSSFINTGMSYNFRYRVPQLGSGWIETNNLQVPLLGLKPGDYTFEINSVNGHGQPGQIRTLQFHILTPWFKRWWFIALLGISSLSITFYLLHREKKRIELSRNLARMELRVLRAQMNPHFIFNSLNSIQRFLLKRDFVVVNQYISSFAKLIRSSLHYSSIETISIKEEEIFLKNYLEIEKLRFQDLFEYNIHIAPNIESDDTGIPTFMIQPLIENCIRHAFKKVSAGGIIHVRFAEINKDYIRVDVLDNGVGLPENFSITDSARPGDSIGLSIVQQRVKLLQTKFKSRLTSIHLINRTDGPGTHATLILPINRP